MAKRKNKFTNAINSISYSKGFSYVTAKSRLNFIIDKRVKIIFYSEEADWSTFRYRCFNVAHELNLSDQMVGATWFSGKELTVLLNIPKINYLILSRVPYSEDLNKVVHKLRIDGTKIIFDIDDLVFDL